MHACMRTHTHTSLLNLFPLENSTLKQIKAASHLWISGTSKTDPEGIVFPLLLYPPPRSQTRPNFRSLNAESSTSKKLAKPQTLHFMDWIHSLFKKSEQQKNQVRFQTGAIRNQVLYKSSKIRCIF